MITQANLGIRRVPRMAGAVPAVLAGLLCGASGHVAAQGAADPSIRVAVVPADGSFRVTDDPTAAIWARVPEESVELRLAPPVHQSISLLHETARDRDTPVLLRIGAVSDRRKIYFRLRWKDATRDDARGIDSYPDGVAIQLPSTEQPTSPMMGLPEAPVEIWRWSASTDSVEALTAGGPGTVTGPQDVVLGGRGVYRGDFDATQREWVVVISRDLQAADGASSPFWKSSSTPVAFAVWQGSDAQRGGYKRVSGWVEMGLEAIR